MAFDVSTFATWVMGTYNLVTGTSNPPPGSRPVKKQWLPEGMCVITQLAIIALYPSGHAAWHEAPRGVKIGFDTHSLMLFPPNFSQKVTRKIWASDKNELVKLPQAITMALLMLPPDRTLVSTVTLRERGIIDLLNNDGQPLPSLMRIYLYALHGIRCLAKTYGYSVRQLYEPINDIEDPTELRYLKWSAILIEKALYGKPPEGTLSTIGKDAANNWSMDDFNEIDRHLTDGLKGDVNSETRQSEIRIVQDMVDVKALAFGHLCRTHCLGVAPEAY